MDEPTDVLRHRLLREVVRHYKEFEELCASSGDWEIEHRGIRINFLDLQGAFRELSPRKKEAIMWNVVYDKKQIEVAEKMGITTVSVGQYVEAGFTQVAAKLFSELPAIE